MVLEYYLVIVPREQWPTLERLTATEIKNRVITSPGWALWFYAKYPVRVEPTPEIAAQYLAKDAHSYWLLPVVGSSLLFLRRRAIDYRPYQWMKIIALCEERPTEEWNALWPAQERMRRPDEYIYIKAYNEYYNNPSTWCREQQVLAAVDYAPLDAIRCDNPDSPGRIWDTIEYIRHPKIHDAIVAIAQRLEREQRSVN